MPNNWDTEIVPLCSTVARKLDMSQKYISTKTKIIFYKGWLQVDRKVMSMNLVNILVGLEKIKQ